MTITSVLLICVISLWWMLDDRPAINITDVEFLSPTVVPSGIRMIYKFTVHKIRDCPGEMQIDINGPVIWRPSQPYLGGHHVGQKKTEVHWIHIPEWAPPGEYSITLFARHRCNPLRSENYETKPIPFTVAAPSVSP